MGSTYVACAGLKSSKNTINTQKFKNESTSALSLSFEILKSIKDFHYELDNKRYQLKMRIGIHYGRVVAGVIGHHKPQFSLIGDTVNTASRMCSNSAMDKITISSSFYDRVASSKYLFKQKKIKAKGKGELTVYEVYLRDFSKIESKTKRVSCIPIGLEHLNSC